MKGFKYSTIRNDIVSGDLIYFRTGSPIARLIQAVTGRYNHTGIAAWGKVAGRQRLFILEETPAGRQLSNMSLRAAKVAVYRIPDSKIFRPNPDCDVVCDALAQLATNTGAPYSIWNAVVGGLNLPLSWRSNGGNICSQLTARYVQLINASIIPDRHPTIQEKYCGENFIYVEPSSATNVS